MSTNKFLFLGIFFFINLNSFLFFLNSSRQENLKKYKILKINSLNKKNKKTKTVKKSKQKDSPNNYLSVNKNYLFTKVKGT